MTNELGTRMRQLRKRACLTQEQLAELAEVSVSTIGRLENGRLPEHRLRTLQKVAEVLNVKPEEWQRLTATLDGQPALADLAEVMTPDGTQGEPTPAAQPEEPVPTGQPGEPPPAVQRQTQPGPPAPAAPLPVPEQAVPSPAGPLVDAAASLAREVGRRWQREEKHRRVHDPFPLPVRYQSAPAVLMDRPENIQRLQPGVPARDLDLNGDLRTVADTYRSVESQRLVILGRAGSGKSILAIRFVLDLLAAPSSSLRVPVILSIGSWDPLTITPRDLLVDHLLRDHPHLARTTPEGATLAAELVDSDLILPVLDGFDELAEALRGPALEALNATSHPVVLTSRRDEYARAVHDVHTPLVLAACVELADLTVEDLAAYLPRTDRLGETLGSGGATGVWDAVLDELRVRDTPASNQLGQVLGTPLMVTLARTMYSEVPGNDPVELLDTARFPTGRHLEEHLLANFVPTVYRHRTPERADPAPGQRNRDPDQAERWLGYLAHSLATGAHERRDLAWWRLGASVRLPMRILHTALLGGLCMFAANWIVVLFALSIGYMPSVQGPAMFEVAVFGLCSAVVFGLAHCALAAVGRTVAVPTQVRLRLAAVAPRVEHRPVREILTRFGVGLLGGSVLGVAHAWTNAMFRALAGTIPRADLIGAAIQDTLALGLIFGLTAGLSFGLVAAFEAPVDIAAAATPMRLLSVNRSTATRQFLMLAAAVTAGLAVCGHAVIGLLQQVLPWTMVWPLDAALLLGAVGGLGGSAAYVLALTAWGQWLTVGRFWLPLTRRLPWDTAAFLDDAYHRGVLRQAGAVYQFRHIRLQQHLARVYGRSGRVSSYVKPGPRRRASDERASSEGR
ncbi:helix-turn-helix domain-containing protein [Streptomyces sp. M2CJ-2]|uniref:helix-turn-helix domain-containing protein n=1 Tax=Streptomyces sp. M2CJ-2 TaxID=2803948 RepID=UPI0019276554|nr:helix-turn-helix domain-containing protein [Streptomyces sp. M2CJ-2]MBL3671479.1 helix-turn-helix domain-containing protein [Streptomyces sp. M2CJ-2]